uniref:Pumilio 23 n=2 Tax=Anthurium amnicola TaxID=1678845 RepID=A0A1D1ZIW6_9ARAE
MIICININKKVHPFVRKVSLKLTPWKPFPTETLLCSGGGAVFRLLATAVTRQSYLFQFTKLFLSLIAYKFRSMVEKSVMVKNDNPPKGRKKNSKRNLWPKKGHPEGDEEHISSNEGGKRRRQKRSSTGEGYFGVEKNCHLENSPKMSIKNAKAPDYSQAHGLSTAQTSIVRKKVDPETANYFYKIANLFETNEIDLEERSVICGNALEETRGKELELVTDAIISHTLQTLLEGCDLDQLCSFLLSCAKVFSHIATDKCGSHVAETAFRSLAAHAHDPENYPAIEDILKKMCEAVTVDSVNVMSSPYGSHVLRSLICLCKGVAMGTLVECHATKSSVLAERLNSKLPQSSGKNPEQLQHGFPDTFKFLVVEILRYSKDQIAALCVNKYSSFVLQTLLKLLVGDDQVLLHMIGVLLGCPNASASKGCLIETARVQSIMNLLEETASSHLLEVILEVAPENYYDEILTKVFRGSLPKISTHICGNFVVQALLSSAKSQGQVDLIWEEINPHLRYLLEMGKSGVIVSLLAACQRFQIHGHECCQKLADAVCLDSEFPSSIVRNILFLESYFSCKDKSSWQWPVGEKMHTLGCLILQTIFKYPKKFIHPYIRSILSMDSDLLVLTAKDAGGGRVLESFLCSDSSTNQKLKIIARLQGHFGELSMHPSGSFTVEKCFGASDLSLKETIASELSAMRAELSKTKHGPYVIKKLDIDGLEAQPDQWRKRQATKEMAYREFHATFGFDNHQERNTQTSSKKKTRRHKKSRLADRDNDVSPLLASVCSELPDLETSIAKLGFPKVRQGHKQKRAEAADSSNKRFIKNLNSSSFPRQFRQLSLLI